MCSQTVLKVSNKETSTGILFFGLINKLKTGVSFNFWLKNRQKIWFSQCWSPIARCTTEEEIKVDEWIFAESREQPLGLKRVQMYSPPKSQNLTQKLNLLKILTWSQSPWPIFLARLLSPCFLFSDQNPSPWIEVRIEHKWQVKSHLYYNKPVWVVWQNECNTYTRHKCVFLFRFQTDQSKAISNRNISGELVYTQKNG